MDNATNIEAWAGEHISMAATRAVTAAQRERCRGVAVTLTFNEIVLDVQPGATAGDVEAEYIRRSDARAKAWEASPEGQKRMAEMAASVAKAQAKVDRAVLALDTLDYQDLDAVLTWCERLTDAADLIGVRVPKDQILEWFALHGWTPSMNCGRAFDANDRENFAGYIIGQALDGIRKVGVPHPLLHGFVEQWRQTFEVR